MEQKKLLLVAISVGVFLVIVIGAGILVFGPQTQTAGTNSIAPGSALSYTVNPAPAQQPAVGISPDTPASVNASELIQNGVPGLQTRPEGTLTTVDTFQVNGQSENTAPKETQVTVTVEPRPAAGVPTAAPQGRAAPAAQTQPKTTVKPAASTTAKPAANPAPAVKTYNDYWVQAGSFNAKARAEDVKETLATKGITSIIENRDVNGATYFRVRIGPYTSQNEADYWLSLIKSINGFEGSQIWQNSSVR
jgi:DedD protein